MIEIWAEQALLPTGWAERVKIRIADGKIAEVASNTEATGQRVGILLPAPVNLHSHVFQRAMAGLTEARGPGGRDSFWTWRNWMYRFVDHLTPDEVQKIAAFVQMEMLEAGYGAVAEFHYLHHGPDGISYENRAEMSARIAAAAADTGIGLTLLPVLYTQGGCDGRHLEGGQCRFGNDLDGFATLMSSAEAAIASLPPDTAIGVAPHSLRAVSPSELDKAVAIAGSRPIHIHIAEQTAEVAEVEAAYGARPVAWLADNQPLSDQWCLIHATHMTDAETTTVANSGATAGLCPITESNLGDGVFNGTAYSDASGSFGVGTDSNVQVSLTGELRQLEYSQRLTHRSRAALADTTQSTGRALFHGAVNGGAVAAQRGPSGLVKGAWADLVALDSAQPDFIGRRGDAVLDSWIFARAADAVTDVWSAGRHVVEGGRHRDHDRISGSYKDCLTDLLARI
ncbi:MAG: formimidoylglutamate deiminase [Pseudomonadota bacterium]